MPVRPSQRIDRLEKYAFAELDRKAAALRRSGCEPIDFGVGDPTMPTPWFIREATAHGLEAHKAGGYPSYEGEPFFREAVASWMRKRFSVAVDPEQEICITLGSKEAVFNSHEAFVNPGDVVISPSPGYPPYARGAAFAEGENCFYPLAAENGFLPDVEALPGEVAEKASVLWICQPQAPTGSVMSGEELRKVAAYCRQHDILLCSDEAYIDIYYDNPPESLIQHAREGILVFYSLSKRSAMTGYRCGWVAGDPEAIARFRKLKTNIDSGVPKFIQDGAVAALEDETHVEAMRKVYRRGRDLLAEALVEAGLPRCVPRAGIFLWQRTQGEMSGLDLAKRFLEPDLALITAPGELLAQPLKPGAEENPGRGYVRMALVPPLERIEEAASRIRKVRLDRFVGATGRSPLR